MGLRKIQVTKFIPIKDNSIYAFYTKGEKLRNFFKSRLENDFLRLIKEGKSEKFDTWLEDDYAHQYRTFEEVPCEKKIRVAIFRSEKPVGETYNFEADTYNEY